MIKIFMDNTIYISILNIFNTELFLNYGIYVLQWYLFSYNLLNRLHADMDSIISIILQDVSDDSTANGGVWIAQCVHVYCDSYYCPL